MNPTPTKPSNAPAKPGPNRPWPRMFAIGAVALLVAAGMAAVLTGLAKDPSADPTQQQAAYTSDALSRVNALGSLEGAISSRGRDLGVPDLGTAEVAELAAELAAAQAALQGALAAADNLPMVPEYYVPGMDLSLDVPPHLPEAYPLPIHETGLTAGEYTGIGLVGDASPVTGRNGLHVPSTGNPAVDDVVAQLMGACDTLRGLVAQAPVPTGVPDPCKVEGLDHLPIPTDVPGGIPVDPFSILGPLPVGDPTGLLGGGMPAPSGQVQDANDAVSPDEQGARTAHLHATGVLVATGGAYSQTEATLQELLATYSGLALQLEELLAQAEGKAELAKEAIPEVLQDRLASIGARADALQAQAQRMAGEYERTARTAAAQALSLAEGASQSHIEDLQSTLDAQVARLNMQAKEISALAESRRVAVEALVASAVANLTRMAEESGVDASAQVAAIQAAGKAALANLEAQATSEVEVLRQTAVLLQARAQAAVPRMASLGLRATEAINATLEDALERAGAAKQYLTDFATAQAAVAMAAEAEAMEKALGTVDVLLERHTDKLKQTALALVTGVPDVVNSTADLVEKASELAESEVGKDLDYIAKVASDYSKVPTDERMARAQVWNALQLAGRDSVVVLDGKGEALNGLAAQVVAAAAGAKAQVESIA